MRGSAARALRLTGWGAEHHVGGPARPLPLLDLQLPPVLDRSSRLPAASLPGHLLASCACPVAQTFTVPACCSELGPTLI
jgi:hypothetical protein